MWRLRRNLPILLFLFSISIMIAVISWVDPESRQMLARLWAWPVTKAVLLAISIYVSYNLIWDDGSGFGTVVQIVAFICGLVFYLALLFPFVWIFVATVFAWIAFCNLGDWLEKKRSKKGGKQL